jgi:hypothetical protein
MALYTRGSTGLSAFSPVHHKKKGLLIEKEALQAESEN